LRLVVQSGLGDRIEPNDKVNRIRERVKHWKEGEYQGVTQVTRKLLHHWTDPTARTSSSSVRSKPWRLSSI